MNLSENFTLHELTRSDTATRLGIDNRPDPKQVGNLLLLCKHVLQPLRDHFGKAVDISSGYRSPALNKAVGGSQTSDHSKGCASDLRIKGHSLLEIAQYIQDNLPHTQVILEFYDKHDPSKGWVHVSYVEGNLKNESLTTKDGRTYLKGLVA